MGRFGVGALAGLRRSSVLSQTVAGMVALIVLAIAAASLPAYGLIHGELERQAWRRVEQGATATSALLEAEQARLVDLATLAAQRPTLRRLMRDGTRLELEGYLDTFRSGGHLDQVVVRDASGAVIAGEELPGFPGSALSGEAQVLVDPAAGAGVAIAATSEIPEDEGGGLLGTVSVVRLLDTGFLEDLAAKTGLEYSLVLDGQRAASTLPASPDGPPAEVPAAASAAVRTAIGSAGTPYYSVTTGLGAAGSRVGLEIALPVADMQVEERRALSVLAATTLAAAASVSALAYALSRSLTRPLDRLTQAAQRIREGDLDTPVPIPSGPAEVAALATALEEGREHTRRTVAELLREKAWSDALIQSVVEGIVTLDRSSRIATFSPGAERLIGWPATEAVGQFVGNVFRTPDGVPFLGQLPPPGGRRPVQVVDRFGRALTLSVTDARFRVPADGGERLVLVLRDVSEDEATRQLRSYFLANISHEFRTPLSAIHASVELLLEDLGDLSKDEIGGLLHSVYLSVTGLQTLIDNLLESLSIEAGRFTIRRHVSRLEQVVERSVTVMRPLLDRREQTLAVELAPSLPAVWMDPMRVTQVVVNLLSNASKYSPVRSPIDLRVDQPDADSVRVSVSDRGEGIALPDRENLFRRFVRLEPADPGQYGVGLGLSVVKAIVEEHGGGVGIEARDGGGSTFWFTLPLRGGLP